jgi:Ca-activated chloride channel family protein
MGGAGGGFGAAPAGLYYLREGASPGGGRAPEKVADFAKKAQQKPGELAENRGKFEDRRLGGLPASDSKALPELLGDQEAKQRKEAFDRARSVLAARRQQEAQSGKLGVDLSVAGNNLRYQCNLTQTASQCVADRNVLEIGGVWIDEGFDPKMPVCEVKAMSDAYFRLLEKQPKLKDVFKLGNHLVWVTPNQTALVIDTGDGKEQLTDAEIEGLFSVKK